MGQVDTEAGTQKYCDMCSTKSKKTESNKTKSKPKAKQQIGDGGGGSISANASPATTTAVAQRGEGEKKLRILCLHGFRQTAKSFRGRTAAIRKRMKKLPVEFVYVDAPFAIKEYNQFEAAAKTKEDSQQLQQEEEASAKRSWLLAHENASNFEASWDQSLLEKQKDPGDSDSTGWDMAFSYIKDQIQRLGPFDGILGFSQGAAITALYCATMDGKDALLQNLKFVMICSGYKSKAHPEIFASVPEGTGKASSYKYINIPSLHVIGGSDKQISVERSEELADCFDPSTRSILRHDQGHIIPCGKSYVDDYVRFLEPYFP